MHFCCLGAKTAELMDGGRDGSMLFSLLPRDVLGHVLLRGRLSLGDIGALSQTCKTLYRAVGSNDPLWTRLAALRGLKFGEERGRCRLVSDEGKG